MAVPKLKPRAKVISACILCGVVGIAVGLCARADGLFRVISNALSSKMPEPEGTEEAKGDPHGGLAVVEVTPGAARSLKLKSGPAIKTDFLKTVRVPGFVVEKPGHSGRTVSSRVRGIIREIYCSPGQLVHPGDRLFRVELTGDGIVTAQVSLLELHQLIGASKKELARIQTLVDRRTAPASQLVPIQIELTRLNKQFELRRKELLVRGLTAKLIDEILAAESLRDSFVISVPGREHPDLESDSELAATDGEGSFESPLFAGPIEERPEEFTVEEINVHPGQSVEPGDQLADLAWHDVLAVEGHAFERDVDSIANLARRGWKARIEYGAHDGEGHITDLDVKFVDNHVDKETGTFRFFLEIRNEEFHKTTDESGRTFKSWRFKPGQRVHILIPVEKLADQFVFPRAAVVEDGIESFVFRRHSQTADFDEYEAVPVSVLYRDARSVVVASDGQLKEHNRVALNSAYQLLLGTRVSEGSGHSHPHPHP